MGEGRGRQSAVAVVLVVALGCTAPSAASRSAPTAGPPPAAGSPASPAAPTGAATPSPAPVPLEVALTQYRSDQALRRVQVKVTNTGAEPVRVDAVRLDADGFTPEPPTPKDAVLGPGGRVDLPVPLGAPRCPPADRAPAATPEPPVSAGEARVDARIRVGDAPARDVTLDLPAPDPLLDRLLAVECAQRALAEAVQVGFGPTWTPATATAGDQPVLRGTVELRRRATAAEVVVTGLGGSVIFTLRPAPERAPPLLTLATGLQTAAVGVEVLASRCDAHALADSKRTFAFPAWVRVGDGPETFTTLTPDAAGRARLEELVRVGCDL